MAKTPESSEYTSMQMRIDNLQKKSGTDDQVVPIEADGHEEDNLQSVSLLPFVGNHRLPMPAGIPFTLIDYIDRLDWQSNTGQ